MGYERSGRYYRDDGGRRWGGRHRDDERDHRDRERSYRASGDYDDDRGFFDRAGDEVRSWFGDEDAERRRRWDERIRQREDERRYGEGGRYADPARGYGYDMADSGLRGGAYEQFANARRPETYGVGRGAGATSTYGLGAGPDHDGWGLDPNYRAWRQRQMDALDRDYDEYRRENQHRFEQDFGGWRNTRQGQRQLLKRVEEHQEVVGSDGAHIGTIDHVRGDRALLTKSDKSAGGRHHSIPCSWIAEVDDKVHLNRTAAQAQGAWKDEEQSEGPHYLDRAFPGTY
jgi:hypothetical protein